MLNFIIREIEIKTRVIQICGLKLANTHTPLTPDHFNYWQECKVNRVAGGSINYIQFGENYFGREFGIY